MPINEREILTACANNPVKTKNFESRKELAKLFARVWLAYTKLIKKHVEKGRCATTEYFGRFWMVTSASGGEDRNFCFEPDANLITKVGIRSRASSPTKIGQRPVMKVSPSAIADVCQTTRETVMSVLEDVQLKVAKMVREGHEVQLGFIFGTLKVDVSRVTFAKTAMPRQSPNLRIGESVRSMAFTDSRSPSPDSSKFTAAFSTKSKVFSSNPNQTELRGNRENFRSTVGSRFAETSSHFSPDARDLLLIHEEEIRKRKAQQVADREKEKEEENSKLSFIRDQLRQERRRRENEVRGKSEVFMRDNLMQRRENQDKRNQVKKDRMNESYDYFPFVYGDQVEDRRKGIRKQLKDEYAQKAEHDRQQIYMSESSSVVSGRRRNRSFNQKMSQDYLTDFPAFLKSAEDSHSPNIYKERNNTSLQSSMQLAISRFEIGMNKIEDDYKKIEVQGQTQQARMEREKRFVEGAKKARQLEVARVQEKQIRDKHVYDRITLEKEREKANTSFGPEESPERIQKAKDHEKRNREIMKDNLGRQLNERDTFAKTRLHKEREADLDFVSKTDTMNRSDRFQEMNARNRAKDHLRGAWIQQMKMKELEREINTLK
mmetsp:Transcript_17303/g.19500  ORF Transcript_17303/g.19500 Transcript_17303/m.19500 type:complete len:604 (+) Transcript_17303:153-1964(+)